MKKWSTSAQKNAQKMQIFFNEVFILYCHVKTCTCTLHLRKSYYLSLQNLATKMHKLFIGLLITTMFELVKDRTLTRTGSDLGYSWFEVWFWRKIHELCLATGFGQQCSTKIFQTNIIRNQFVLSILTRVGHSVIMRMTMIWLKWRFLHALLNQVV